MLHPTLETKLPEVLALLKNNKVKRAFAFGSVTTPRFYPDSDIDLLIAFEDDLEPKAYAHHFWTLYLNLPKILGHPVDLITEDSLRNPYFIDELEETKIQIYEQEGEEIFV